MTFRPYSSADRLLSYLSATWCGVAILLVGASSTVITGTLIYETLVNTAGVDVWHFVGQAFVSFFIVLVLGVAFGRFLLRALPPQLSYEAPRGGFRVLGAIALCAAFMGCFIVVVVFGALALSASDASTATRDRAVALLGTSLASVLPAMLWTTGAIGPLIVHHRKPRAFLKRPFVLFLRRFSTFSDRAVVALVLKQTAPSVPVVFLTPTLSRPGD